MESHPRVSAHCAYGPPRLEPAMVVYEEDGVFPATPDLLWKLLERHLDDVAIHQIHPLVLTQHTWSHAGPETIVERAIDVRGKSMRSKWKITYTRPTMARWDILESEGPWAPGSFVENRYSPAPGGTRIQTRGELKINVLPFFLPQKGLIRRLFDDLDKEDRAALNATA
jgi:hypothetical protein